MPLCLDTIKPDAASFSQPEAVIATREVSGIRLAMGYSRTQDLENAE